MLTFLDAGLTQKVHYVISLSEDYQFFFFNCSLLLLCWPRSKTKPYTQIRLHNESIEENRRMKNDEIEKKKIDPLYIIIYSAQVKEEKKNEKKTYNLILPR